jgi:hypothetical protein
LLREGAVIRGGIIPNSISGSKVPRHWEIKDTLAKKIWRDLGIPLAK